MQSTQIPQRLPLPFGAAAGGSYIHTVPTASQIGITDGAASLTDGFVPLNATEIAAGGVPPFMNDMNGILNVATAWAQWAAACGPVQYNSAFSAAIGGYPKGNLLLAANGVSYWFSLVEDNTVDPDAGASVQWQAVGFGGVYAGNPNGNVAGIAASSGGITASLIFDEVNFLLWICTVTGDAAGAVWSGVTGSVVAVGVNTANGFAGVSSGGSSPSLTLATTVANGMVKAAAGALAAALAGTDFVAPSQFLTTNQSLVPSPGWQAFPGGFMLQWGLTTPVPDGATGLVVNFGTAFPVACYVVVPVFTNAATPGLGSTSSPNITAITASNFTITQQSGVAAQYLWIAVGRWQ